MIAGIYYVITGGVLPNWIWLASVPYGIAVTAILFGKYIDKHDFDKNKGIKTLPVIIGEKCSRIVNIVIMGLFYIIIILLFTFKFAVITILLILLSIPRYLRVAKYYLHPKPKEKPEGWPILPLWFVALAFHWIRLAGGLFVLGLLINVFLSLNWRWFC